MSSHVIEIVAFRSVGGPSQERVPHAAEQATAFMTGCPGFLRRRPSCAEDGARIGHAERASPAGARAGAVEIQRSEPARALMRAVDGPGVRLARSEPKVSVG